MRMGVIYVLLDPETLEPRYVGKTVKSPAHRLRGHINGAYRVNTETNIFSVDTYCARWIRTLSASPRISVIEVVPENDLNTAEKLWIKVMRDRGVRLCNISSGGDGGSGPRTPESCAKASATKLAKAKKFDAAVVVKRRHNGESIAKIASDLGISNARARQALIDNGVVIQPGMRGRHLSQKTRDKIGLASAGRLVGIETRIKLGINASKRGKPFDAASVIERYQNGETLGKICRDLHISGRRIRQALIDGGVTIRHERHHTKETRDRLSKIAINSAKPFDVPNAIERYKNGETLKQIGQSLHVSGGRIRQALVDNNVPFHHGTRGRHASQETRTKISIANKVRFSDPEERTKMSDRNKGRVVPPETRVKISATMTKSIDATTVIKQYENGETPAEIGHALHVSGKRVRKILVDNGVTIKRRGER